MQFLHCFQILKSIRCLHKLPVRSENILLRNHSIWVCRRTGFLCLNQYNKKKKRPTTAIMERLYRSACPKAIPTPTFGIIPLSGRLVKVYPEGGKNMRRKITAGLILRKDGRYQRNELIGDKRRTFTAKDPAKVWADSQ